MSSSSRFAADAPAAWTTLNTPPRANLADALVAEEEGVRHVAAQHASLFPVHLPRLRHHVQQRDVVRVAQQHEGLQRHLRRHVQHQNPLGEPASQRQVVVLVAEAVVWASRVHATAHDVHLRSQDVVVPVELRPQGFSVLQRREHRAQVRLGQHARLVHIEHLEQLRLTRSQRPHRDQIHAAFWRELHALARAQLQPRQRRH